MNNGDQSIFDARNEQFERGVRNERLYWVFDTSLYRQDPDGQIYYFIAYAKGKGYWSKSDSQVGFNKELDTKISFQKAKELHPEAFPIK